MNTVCLKILSMSIVLTVCSIDPNVAYGDMSNAMRAIALMSESESVYLQNGDKSLECTYVIDLSQESAEEIAYIITLADQINKQLHSNSKKIKKTSGFYNIRQSREPIYMQSLCATKQLLPDCINDSQWFTSKLFPRPGPHLHVG